MKIHTPTEASALLDHLNRNVVRTQGGTDPADTGHTGAARKPLNDWQRRTIIRMREQGHTIAKIARTIHAGNERVSEFLKYGAP